MSDRERITTKAARLARKPYSVQVWVDAKVTEGKVWVASTPELPGCIAQGDTADEATRNLEEARQDYIASLLEDGLEVPGPCSRAVSTSAGVDSTTEEATWQGNDLSKDELPIPRQAGGRISLVGM